MVRETKSWSLPGSLMIVALLAGVAAGGFTLIGEIGAAQHAMRAPAAGPMIAGVVLLAVCLIAMRGLFIINPNEARVMQLFGRYAGSERRDGLRWTNPFYEKKVMSLRVRNLESDKLKVNDLDGNPIEIAAVVVWRVGDSAEASFNVDSYGAFLTIQAESALRDLASQFPYDAHDDEKISLRSHAHEISERLKKEMQTRLDKAGIEVLETRMTHLAYAPEIAQAMLQRQQAGAIIAARQRIVDGAVGMVEMALQRLAENHTVVLDEERKAAMVSNLLVVLCGERATQPVINAGSLYTG